MLGLPLSYAPTHGRSNTTIVAIDEAPNRRLEQGSAKLRALLVEDEPADVELALRVLRHAGFEATGDNAQTAEEFTELVRKNSYDVILADYKLPNWNGMESVEVLRREGLDIPVILVSGALGEITAVECIKQGAFRLPRPARAPKAYQRVFQAIDRGIRGHAGARGATSSPENPGRHAPHGTSGGRSAESRPHRPP